MLFPLLIHETEKNCLYLYVKAKTSPVRTLCKWNLLARIFPAIRWNAACESDCIVVYVIPYLINNKSCYFFEHTKNVVSSYQVLRPTPGVGNQGR